MRIADGRQPKKDEEKCTAHGKTGIKNIKNVQSVALQHFDGSGDGGGGRMAECVCAACAGLLVIHSR